MKKSYGMKEARERSSSGIPASALVLMRARPWFMNLRDWCALARTGGETDAVADLEI